MSLGNENELAFLCNKGTECAAIIGLRGPGQVDSCPDALVRNNNIMINP